MQSELHRYAKITIYWRAKLVDPDENVKVFEIPTVENVEVEVDKKYVYEEFELQYEQLGLVVAELTLVVAQPLTNKILYEETAPIENTFHYTLIL